MNTPTIKAALWTAITLAAAVTPLHAGIHVMDFNQVATPGFDNPVGTPHQEGPVILTASNSYGWRMFGPSAPRATGTKAISPKFTGTTSTVTIPGGGSFKAVSIRLCPYGAGMNGTVTFIGTKPGNVTESVTFSSGTNLAGTVHTFPPSFNGLTSLHWIMSGSSTYHQFDDITVEIPPVATVPAAITVNEAHGTCDIVIPFSEPYTGSPTLLSWTVTGGTATQGSDYSGLPTNGWIQVDPGDTQAVATFNIIDDLVPESMETINITWSSAPNDLVLPVTTTAISIGDNDAATFENYVAAHGLAGNDALAEADPNNDGIPNMLAYACKMNPAGPNPPEWLDRLPHYVTDGSNRPALRYILPQPAPDDVKFEVMESPDLEEWTIVAARSGYGIGTLWSGPCAGILSDSSTRSGRTVTVPSAEPLTSQPRTFLRLELKKTSGIGNAN